MPESDKSLKKKEQAKNRAAGIGDEQGRLPSRVKPEEIKAKCTICSTEIRVTKTNTEAKQHADSRHPTSTFALCFPGIFDPTVVVPSATASTAVTSNTPASSSNSTAAPAPTKKKAAKPDFSLLDAAIAGKK